MKRIITSASAAITAFSLCSGILCTPELLEARALKIGEGFQYEITEDNEITILGFSNTREPVEEIPSEIEGLPVTTIHYLFGNIEELVLPSSVTTIDDGAFKNNTRLRTVTIPASVTQTGTSLFDGCTALEYCDFGASVAQIPKSAFNGCTALQSISYGDSVTSFASHVFQGCSSLKSVTIPPEMTELPERLLNGCSSLQEIRIPDSVTAIGAYALGGCSSLTEITIPEGVTAIGEYAFSDCTSVTELVIPESVEVISNGLFKGCTQLAKVDLPEYALNFYENNTTEIFARDLFRGCASLTEVVLPYGLEDIGSNCFDGCTALEFVYIPDTIKTIDSYAFRSCASLQQVDIPHASTVYGVETFLGCTSLKEIYVPETVYDFGFNCDNTFDGCTALERVYLPDNSRIHCGAFTGCDSLTEIYVGSEGAFASSYEKGKLGYVYDAETDTYTKRDDLTIYCRSGSTAQQYAQENGFACEIVEGSSAQIVAVYNYAADETEPESYSLHAPDPAFISGDGTYRVSDNSNPYQKRDDMLDLVISTGMSAAEYPELAVIPVEVNFNGTDISEIYETAVYSLETAEDGMYYLFIHAETPASKGESIGQVNVFLDVYTSGVTEYLMGDVNLDGEFNVLDAVLLQKWLLNAPDASLALWQAGDFYADGVLDGFDLAIMKRALLSEE